MTKLICKSCGQPLPAFYGEEYCADCKIVIEKKKKYKKEKNKIIWDKILTSMVIILGIMSGAKVTACIIEKGFRMIKKNK